MTKEQLHSWLYHANAVRGNILDTTIFLERLMDEYISSHFCSDNNKKNALIKLLLAERVEFSKKAEVFIRILKANCIKEGDEFNKIYPRIRQDFEDISRDRNYFAHKPTSNPTDDNIHMEIIL